jgi:hypothetical protein
LEKSVGQLTEADELFCHQTTETFANVATSDPAWTERAYGCVIAKDDGFALHWGLGKYVNRNVMDGFAGIAIGRTQRNVRFSRRLAPRPMDMAVGPFRLEVVEPLKATRAILEPTEHQPISFDITQRVIDRPWQEDRSVVTRGYRTVQEDMRYVLCTEATGWVEVEGRRIAIEAPGGFGFRDHSWGIKQNTGPASPETPDRGRMPVGLQYRLIWSPCVLTLPDGQPYRLHMFCWETHSARGSQIVNESKIFAPGPSGGVQHVRETRFDLRYDPATREPLGGHMLLVLRDGSERPIHIEIAGQSRVCLGMGLYNGYGGHYHGEARGALHVEGDMLPDTGDPAACEAVHQLRDILIRVSDPVTGGTGWGILNTEITGAWPDLGLQDANWR